MSTVFAYIKQADAVYICRRGGEEDSVDNIAHHGERDDQIVQLLMSAKSGEMLKAS